MCTGSITFCGMFLLCKVDFVILSNACTYCNNTEITVQVLTIFYGVIVNVFLFLFVHECGRTYICLNYFHDVTCCL